MRAEQLFMDLAGLEDKYLERSEAKGYRFHGKKILPIAAGIVLVLVMGAIVYKAAFLKPAEEKPSLEVPEGYVEIADLLPSDESIATQGVGLKTIVMEEYTIEYREQASAGSDVLKNSLGNAVSGNDGWYKVAGHEDMLYLILQEKGEYSLWKFSAFRCKEYPYKKVLEMIYHINSAKDILEIVSAPANMDMTDEGMALQKEIGTLTITEREKIDAIYQIISNMTCYGDNNWERIGLSESGPEAMQEYVRLGRYLTVTTSTGLKVEDLKYTGVTKLFYEYSGIAYNQLSDLDGKTVEEILQIQ